MLGLGTFSLVQPAIVAASAAATAQPALASRAFHFSADAITPQTDDTVIGTWTDSVAGISMTQATGANKPFYRASRLGSKPAVQFKGLNWLTLGRPTQLINALNHSADSTGTTMFFVMANVDSVEQNFAAYWCPTNISDNGRTLTIAGGHVGCQNSKRLFTALGSGIQIVVIRSDSVVTDQVGQLFHNMNCFSSGSLSPHATNNYQVGGDGSGSDVNWTYKGDMMELGCYNRILTTAEVAQLVKWACDKYGQAYPWAGATRFHVFDGDSIGAGVGATATTGRSDNQNGWTTLLADAKGVAYGANTNLCISGRRSDGMLNSVTANYAGLQAQIGIPLIVHAMEYYNKPDSDAVSMKAFTAAVKAVSSSIITVVGSSTDNGDAAGTTFHDNRAAFNVAIAGDTNINVFVPLHTDTTVGVEGACPNDPGPYGPNFTDHVHPANPGHLALKNFWSSYYDTAVLI